MARPRAIWALTPTDQRMQGKGKNRGVWLGASKRAAGEQNAGYEGKSRDEAARPPSRGG